MTRRIKSADSLKIMHKLLLNRTRRDRDLQHPRRISDRADAERFHRRQWRRRWSRTGWRSWRTWQAAEFRLKALHIGLIECLALELDDQIGFSRQFHYSEIAETVFCDPRRKHTDDLKGVQLEGIEIPDREFQMKIVLQAAFVERAEVQQTPCAFDRMCLLRDTQERIFLFIDLAGEITDDAACPKLGIDILNRRHGQVLEIIGGIIKRTFDAVR